MKSLLKSFVLLAITALGATAQTASFTTTTTNYDAAGGTVTFDVSFDYTGQTLSSLGLSITLPTGWSYEPSLNAGVPAAANPPNQLTTGALELFYISAPANSVSFPVTLSYESTLLGDQSIGGLVTYSIQGGGSGLTAALGPVVIAAPLAAPNFTLQPQSTTVNEGDSATFYVAVDGNPTPTLQWNKDGSPISGATDLTIMIDPVAAGDAGSYTVTATNSQGSATSDAATLTVNTAPVITDHPDSATVNQGQDISLSVTANGTQPLSYQWHKGSSSLSGETGVTLQLNGVQPQDAGDYHVVVTNSVGNATSNTATITVVETPMVSNHPQDQTVAVGDTITLNVLYTGTEPVSFQWMKNGQDIPGATSATLEILSAQIGDAGTYSVRISNAAGSDVSDNATVTVEHAPVIDEQPEDASTGAGGSVSFDVDAFAVPEISGYQWFRLLPQGSTPEPISGATSDELSLTNLQLSDNGNQYRVEITNSIGTTTSAYATLTVNQGPAFTTHPDDADIAEGGSVTLTVVVTGNPTPTIQWQYSPDEQTDLTDLPGATGTSLVLSNINRSQTGFYQAVATNSIGSAESEEAEVNVLFAPELTQDVQDQTAGVGGSVTFNTEGNANPEPTFQWFRNGQPISGATDGELTLDNLTLDDNGDTFHVVIDNGIGSPLTSRTATLTVNEQAAVTAHPQDVTVTEGGSASFTVGFTGNPAPTIQWQFNGQNIPGATSATYSIPATNRSDSGQYQAVVTNTFGSDTSDPASLDVQFGPEITRDLTDQSAPEGGSVTFSIEGNANPEPAFQWFRNGSPISGATEGDLTLTDLTLKDSGSTFHLVANNGIGGDVQSATATLTVYVLPSFTLQPVGDTLDVGESHNMSVDVEGSPVPTVQWMLNGSPISGATGLNYTIQDAAASDGGTYTVVATNVGGSTTSNGAVVIVNTPPTIITDPVGASKVVGESHSFTVEATGAQPLSYQWRKDGANISGATSASLTLDPIALGDAGTYDVVVTNRLGSATSAGAVLSVDERLAAPTIERQPVDVVFFAGNTISFSVLASGNPVPAYQWRKNGVAISGATSPTLLINDAQEGDTGAYDVVVSNSQGSVNSNLVRATLTDSNEAPEITSQPRNIVTGTGLAVTFSVAATGAPDPTYQWRFNGVDIPGATGTSYSIASVELANEGAYSVVVTNEAGSVTSRNAQLEVLSAVHEGTYTGEFGGPGGFFTIVIGADNTGRVSLFDPTTGLTFVGPVTVGEDGSFNIDFSSIVVVPSVSAFASDGGAQTPVKARAEFNLAGSISPEGGVNGSVSGGSSINFSGEKDTGTGAEDVAGFYQAGEDGSDTVTYTTVTPSGKVFVVIESSTGSDAGQGTVNSEGQFSVTTNQQQTVAATVTAGTNTIAAEVTDGQGGTTTVSGGSDEVIAAQRLVNISSRTSAGTGEAQSIAGLVITGEDSKPVLIRAVGPGLTAYGVTGVLAQPKLDLYQNGAVIATNTGWSNSADATEIGVAASLAGAFPLQSGDADSAILATLAPGAYTANVTGADGGSGVVLVEVYDLSSPSLGQKLFNISTRATAGSGDETVVAGFVVSGDVPKRVLLRGVGPTLGSYGVQDALTDPRLTLYKGETVVATNDDWADAQAVSEASTEVGAFALDAGSKDAALVINLQPGAYTLHLNGTATGIGLIEVYEIP